MKGKINDSFLLMSFNWYWMPKYFNPTSMTKPLGCFSRVIISTENRRKLLLQYKKKIKWFWSCLCGIATVKQNKQTVGRWIDMPTTHNSIAAFIHVRKAPLTDRTPWCSLYFLKQRSAQRLQQRFHFDFTWNLPFVPYEHMREKLNILIYYINI